LIKLGAIGVAGVAAGGGGSLIATHVHRPVPARYRFFSEPEAALLVEICERIIPRDDAPGATDVGVIHFIDRQLRGRLARYQEFYRRGIESFRQTSLAANGVPFEQLYADKKDAQLRLLESAKAPRAGWSDPLPQEFFRLVVEHTMQGFYGPPRHGGNRGYASYKMLGLDHPQINGRNRPPRI
jgi:gluconate 2-dehydrogenase gamma chain